MYKILIIGALSLTLALPTNSTPVYAPSDKEIMEVYNKLVAATGEINMVPPLQISDSGIVNAYATKEAVILNRGLIKTLKNADELALVLGHELAHETLNHVNSIEDGSPWFVVGRAEAQADKLGAYYMMRAGYDICKGRELYLSWMKEGDYLYDDHPNYSYRYTQLNVNCGTL